MASTKAKPFTERKTANAHMDRWRSYGADVEQAFNQARGQAEYLDDRRRSVERLVVTEILVDVARIKTTEFMERYAAKRALYEQAGQMLGVSGARVKRMVCQFLGEGPEGKL